MLMKLKDNQLDGAVGTESSFGSAASPTGTRGRPAVALRTNTLSMRLSRERNEALAPMAESSTMMADALRRRAAAKTVEVLSVSLSAARKADSSKVVIQSMNEQLLKCTNECSGGPPRKRVRDDDAAGGGGGDESGATTGVHDAGGDTRGGEGSVRGSGGTESDHEHQVPGGGSNAASGRGYGDGVGSVGAILDDETDSLLGAGVFGDAAGVGGGIGGAIDESVLDDQVFLHSSGRWERARTCRLRLVLPCEGEAVFLTSARRVTSEANKTRASFLNGRHIRTHPPALLNHLRHTPSQIRPAASMADVGLPTSPCPLLHVHCKVCRRRPVEQRQAHGIVPSAQVVQQKGRVDDQRPLGRRHAYRLPKYSPAPHEMPKSLLDVHTRRGLVDGIGILPLVAPPRPPGHGTAETSESRKATSAVMHRPSRTITAITELAGSFSSRPKSLQASADESCDDPGVRPRIQRNS